MTDTKSTEAMIFSGAYPAFQTEPPNKDPLNKDAQKQFRNFKLGCRHVWQNKDFGKIWYYAMYCLGFVVHVLLSVGVACTMRLIVFFLRFGNKDMSSIGLHSSSPYLKIIGFVSQIKRVIFMTFFQLFAGLMGLGAYTKVE